MSAALFTSVPKCPRKCFNINDFLLFCAKKFVDKGPDAKYSVSEDHIKSCEIIKCSYFS